MQYYRLLFNIGTAPLPVSRFSLVAIQFRLTACGCGLTNAFFSVCLKIATSFQFEKVTRLCDILFEASEGYLDVVRLQWGRKGMMDSN